MSSRIVEPRFHAALDRRIHCGGCTASFIDEAGSGLAILREVPPVIVRRDHPPPITYDGVFMEESAGVSPIRSSVGLNSLYAVTGPWDGQFAAHSRVHLQPALRQTALAP